MFTQALIFNLFNIATKLPNTSWYYVYFILTNIVHFLQLFKLHI